MSEQQEKIQKYIIKSSPYGELTQVLKDLEKLSPLNLSSETISKTIEQYHQDHLAIIPHQGKNFVIMSSNNVSPGKYIDQQNKKVLTVDLVKGQVISEEDSTNQIMEEVDNLLKDLSEASRKYTANYYRQPYGSQVFMNLSEEALEIFIGLTTKNIQLNNFYTGEWISKWKVTKQAIQGTIQIKAHYFESGNVQFNQKKTYKHQFKFEADMSQNAKKIMKVIEQTECDLQGKLGQLYEDMPNGFFKHLRRITSWTQTKMSWNLNSIKMNQNLMGVTKQ